MGSVAVGQRRYQHGVFAGDPERLAGGGYDAEVGCGLQQVADELAGSGEQVFAAVDDQ
ncbi:hypothetical protein [Nucisporomicrobium flavum]|uniref:hypothetical protein n=1 Tax=Nucisporomicrobium flavum TaxID=2785915 RepID=UPI0018F5EE08|nr:hypothetical protein [Nucisporomicrobium flavum]